MNENYEIFADNQRKTTFFFENFLVNKSDFDGTTPLHNFLLILPMVYTTFFVINLYQTLKIDDANKLWIKLFIEFSVIVSLVILIVTLFEPYYVEVNVILSVLSLILLVLKCWRRMWGISYVEIQTRRPEFLSVARATTNLITAVCILAVDFKAFPHKLAKTEVYGFGLMDVGVGLFVYSNAIVAPELNKHSRLSLRSFKRILVSSSPLIILGVLRYLILKQMGYHVGVTEYGIHWNFFLTLAATKIFGSILLGTIKDISYTKYLAVIVVVVHEISLQNGLSDYVFDTNISRKGNFIAANREGIVSITGYVGLYLSSVAVGKSFKFNNDTSRPRSYAVKCLKMGAISTIFWGLTYLCRHVFGVSRCIANMGYIFWILSIGVTMTIFFCFLEVYAHFIRIDKFSPLDIQSPHKLNNNTIIASNNNTNVKISNEIISPESYVPLVLNSINYNGLFFFLLANIFTGFVNKVIKTRKASTTMSLMILFGYMFVLCAVHVVLFSKRIKLKYW